MSDKNSNKETFDKNSKGTLDCLNKAKDGEPVWIVLGRDPVYEETVEFWAQARERAIADGRIEDNQKERDHIATARRYVSAGWRKIDSDNKESDQSKLNISKIFANLNFDLDSEEKKDKKEDFFGKSFVNLFLEMLLDDNEDDLPVSDSDKFVKIVTVGEYYRKRLCWQPADTAPENGEEFWYFSNGKIYSGSLGHDLGGSIRRDPDMVAWHPKDYFNTTKPLAPWKWEDQAYCLTLFLKAWKNVPKGVSRWFGNQWINLVNINNDDSRTVAFSSFVNKNNQVKIEHTFKLSPTDWNKLSSGPTIVP